MQCLNSGGLLGGKPSNFKGLFDLLRKDLGIKASDVVKILDDYPEMAMQNRRDLLGSKLRLIRTANSTLS